MIYLLLQHTFYIHVLNVSAKMNTEFECSCSKFSQDNYTSNSDDDDLLNLLFGQDFSDFGSISPPRSESTSSDSDMTPSPNTMDDVELSEILSSTSASPGLPQNSEDFTIDLGKYNMFIFLNV